MIGIRIGAKIGAMVGSRIGVGTDQIASQGLAVTKDATSGIYCPANATEWATVLAAAGISSGGPSLLWKCGEAAGNLADSIGAFTGTVTAGSPALSYAQPVAGWSRKGIAAADSTTGNVLNTDAGLPDLSTTSMLVLAYLIPSKPATAKAVLALGTTSLLADVTATPRPGINNGALVGGSFDPTGQVEPWTLQNDVTHSAQVLYTLNDHITATYSARAGKSLKLFSTPPACTALYLAAFFGAAAELTSAQVKTLQQTLGWAPTWT